jgi:ribonuclease HII
MTRTLKPRPTLTEEHDLWLAGHHLIAGVDEAGQGSIAGPLTVAAIILPLPYPTHPDPTAAFAQLAETLNPVLDSKRVHDDRRLKLLYDLILSLNPIYAIGLATLEELEQLKNANLAALLTSQRAIAALPITPDFVLFDNDLAPADFPLPHQSLVKGDAISLTIACASILAKYTCDEHLRALSQQYPAYLFHQHKGYITKEHTQLLERHGPSPAHRQYHKFVKKAQNSHPN